VAATPGLDFGRFSAADGSTRFLGLGFSDGDRGAGREVKLALRVALRASLCRFLLRLSSRSFSRTSLSMKKHWMPSDRAL
jgi:hypothetical protein